MFTSFRVKLIILSSVVRITCFLLLLADLFNISLQYLRNVVSNVIVLSSNFGLSASTPSYEGRIKTI
jgi:hypothetical protein